MTSRSGNNNRAGFSLVELAIVLAIIGIVLASLWGVVSLVRENIKREETLEQMTAIVGKIRDHYQGRPCASTKFDCSLQGENLTHDLIDKGVLLPEQYRKGTNPRLADHPWGSGEAGGTLRVWGVGTNQFRIELNSLKQSSCSSLAGKLSGSGSPTGLASLEINDVDITPLPATPEVAADECDGAGDDKLEMIYRLRP